MQASAAEPRHEESQKKRKPRLAAIEYIRGISYRGIRMASSADIPIPHGKLSEIKSRYLEYAFERKQVVL